MAKLTPVDYDPFAESPAVAAAPEQSFVGGMKLGAKKRALGIAELGLNVANSLGADVSGAKELVGDLGQRYAREGTGTGLKGGVAEFLGDPLTFLPGATLPKFLAQGAAMGATAPTGRADSGLTDNAIGAVSGVAASGLGYGAGKVISKVAKPIGNQLTEVGKAGIRKLEEAGVPLSAAQKTGSKALAALEATFSTLPMTSNAQSKIYEKQREAFTKAALKEAGIDASNASREVIAAASKKFGDEYSALASKNVMNVDDELLSGAARAYQEASNGVLGVDASSLVKKVVRDLQGAGIPELGILGQIDGKVYQKSRSLLTQASQSAKPHEATVLKQLRNELDAAFERSLPEAQRGTMAAINKRYQAFKPIQKAMESSKAEGLKTGNIDPTTLYNQVEVGAPLSNLSDAAAGFLRPTIPDSGTAQRLFMQNALTGAGVASAGYGAGTDNNYALAGGLALAGPKGAQMLYNSKIGQKYLTEGMRPAIQAGANAVAKVLPRSTSSGATLNSAKQPMRVDSEGETQLTPVDYDPFEGQTSTVVEPLSYNTELPATDYLQKLAQVESGGNPNAQAKTSSASGLYQFTNGTWKAMVDKHGQSTGIGLQDKNNPQAQQIMAEIHTKENAAELSNLLGREPNAGELYAAHFLGIGGAKKLLSAYGTGRQAALLFPEAARANRNIFFANGQPRTVEQVYQLLSQKMSA